MGTSSWSSSISWASRSTSRTASTTPRTPSRRGSDAGAVAAHGGAVAAVANLAGAFVTTAVAKTVGKGIIDTKLATEQTVLAALIGAIVWNLLTWRLGLPSCSTHALIGGLVGAALAQSGAKGVEWSGLWHKVARPGRSSPADRVRRRVRCCWSRSTGCSSGSRPAPANRSFRHGQLASGTFVAFTHGANDAQKTMGVIALALYTNGNISQLLHPDLGEGRRRADDRRRHVRRRLADHAHARSARLQAAAGARLRRADRRRLDLWAGTRFGFPISTTHVVSGSVIGAGATRRFSAVRWGVAGNIVSAWLLTMPAAAVVAAALYYPVNWLF